MQDDAGLGGQAGPAQVAQATAMLEKMREPEPDLVPSFDYLTRPNKLLQDAQLCLSVSLSALARLSAVHHRSHTPHLHLHLSR
jgi:hypothetical protein